MKELYFSSENIDKKALEMLNNLSSAYKSADIHFRPKNIALLVVDMQGYFLEESSHAFIPSALAIIPGIKSLINKFNDYNLPVIFTRHLNTKESAGLMGKWWREILTEENTLSKIIPELNLLKHDIIIKSQYDVFHNTDFEDFLRKKEIKQLIITGVMTHLCCETTARSAFVRGFEVLFTVDGTATYNERFHSSALHNLSHGFAVPVLISEIMEKLSNDNI